jgi:hypothetical protein
MIKLPFEIMQGLIGAVCGLFLVFGKNLKTRFSKSIK